MLFEQILKVNYFPAALTSPSNFNLKFLVYLCAVGFILYGMYLLSKYITKNGKINKGNIKIIEKFYITSDKHLLIIELHRVFYLLSVTKGDISLIDKRDDLSELYDNEKINEMNFENKFLREIFKNKKR